MTERLNHLAFLQFIGPIFVIFGHAMNGVAVPEILTSMKAWVYIFHMPLFFFMAGYLFSYSGGLSKGSYGSFLKKKAARLLIPYFIWNLLFIIPKYAASDFINDKVEFTLSYAIQILINPRLNIWGHTWFLFALFVLFVLAYLFDFFRVSQKLYIPITIVFIALNYFMTTDTLFAIGDLMKNTLYFWIGIMLALIPVDKLKKLVSAKLFLFLAVIIVSSTVVWLNNDRLLLNNMVACTSILLLLTGLPLAFNVQGKIIEYASINSFGIYMLHWPCMIVLRIVFYQILNLPAMATFFIMMIGGWFLSVAILEVLKRMPIIKSWKIMKYIVGIEVNKSHENSCCRS